MEEDKLPLVFNGVCVCEQVGEAHAQRHRTYKHTCTIHCMSMYVDLMFLFFILGI